MIFGDSPILEPWFPPPQGDLPRPRWTQLLINGGVVCNSLEGVDWARQPVELLLCEGCWMVGCNMGNLTRIVALEEQLVWMRPDWEAIDPVVRDFIRPGHLLPEAVLLPRAVWDRLCREIPSLPAFEAWPRAARQELASLWLMEMPEAVRTADLAELQRRLRLVVAADPASLEEAVEAVRELIRWVAERLASPVAGRIVRTGGEVEPVNILYFDEPGFPEWPAYVAGPGHAFAFGREWVFQEQV
ncbi:MAG: hypothetical protein JO112_10305 [Planctomycetes bacterium]|nr:hypothetical protein [Planctomycetota bacterium]